LAGKENVLMNVRVQIFWCGRWEIEEWRS